MKLPVPSHDGPFSWVSIKIAPISSKMDLKESQSENVRKERGLCLFKSVWSLSIFHWTIPFLEMNEIIIVFVVKRWSFYLSNVLWLFQATWHDGRLNLTRDMHEKSKIRILSLWWKLECLEEVQPSEELAGNARYRGSSEDLMNKIAAKLKFKHSLVEWNRSRNSRWIETLNKWNDETGALYFCISEYKFCCYFLLLSDGSMAAPRFYGFSLLMLFTAVCESKRTINSWER